jgi:hypothetical protein
MTASRRLHARAKDPHAPSKAPAHRCKRGHDTCNSTFVPIRGPSCRRKTRSDTRRGALDTSKGRLHALQRGLSPPQRALYRSKISGAPRVTSADTRIVASDARMTTFAPCKMGSDPCTTRLARPERRCAPASAGLARSKIGPLRVSAAFAPFETVLDRPRGGWSKRRLSPVSPLGRLGAVIPHLVFGDWHTIPPAPPALPRSSDGSCTTPTSSRSSDLPSPRVSGRRYDRGKSRRDKKPAAET